MYIEYITPQDPVNFEFSGHRWGGEKYRPTWLIQTSNWQKVPGTDADYYHTLSYCWEQSGDKFQRADGEYDLIDNGYHRITDATQEGNTAHVTYDELLQKICKDFKIEYLWYDKLCIDQTNKEEKQREIQQMHLIYSNAQFAVALVPEIHIDDLKSLREARSSAPHDDATEVVLRQITESNWWKRSWTLEETMMSSQMVIVGRNTHLWCTSTSLQDKYTESDFISTEMLGFKSQYRKSANVVLRFAHARTSTKEHDKIFALANILDGIVSVDINYSIDVSVVVRHFYRQLAERDLSVMCFGSTLTSGGERHYAATMASHCLPSWTGAAGMHTLHTIEDILVDGNANWTIDEDMRLRITCRSYTIRSIKTYDAHEYRTIIDEEESTWNSSDYNVFDKPKKLCMDSATGCHPTHYWTTHEPAFHPHRTFPLSLTEDCTECLIPAILFNSSLPGYDTDADGYYPSTQYYNYLLPVLKKSANNGTYKTIGIILVRSYFLLTSPPPEKFLEKLFSDLDSATVELSIE